MSWLADDYLHMAHVDFSMSSIWLDPVSLENAVFNKADNRYSAIYFAPEELQQGYQNFLRPLYAL